MNIKNKIVIGIFIFLPIIGFSQKKQKTKSSSKMTTETKTGEIKTEIDSVSYSLGVNIGSNLKKQGFDSLNVEMFSKALKDIYTNGAVKIDEKQAEAILMEYFQTLQSKKQEGNVKAGEKFLEENKKKPGVITTASGLQYTILKEGNGPKPTPTDMVTTHYHGTLIDGTVFDSSVDRGQPATFPVNGVIPGWVEALPMMSVGSKWRLFIPSNLAYGERGAGKDIGPNSTLIFDVELISIGKQ
jgi:FKBP-type peptidyl-prolyl cis-trans isomerase FklB